MMHCRRQSQAPTGSSQGAGARLQRVHCAALLLIAALAHVWRVLPLQRAVPVARQAQHRIRAGREYALPPGSIRHIASSFKEPESCASAERAACVLSSMVAWPQRQVTFWQTGHTFTGHAKHSMCLHLMPQVVDGQNGPRIRVHAVRAVLRCVHDTPTQ